MMQANAINEITGRSDTIDILKGILIILVVVGHYKVGTLHDIVFLFHMPLFFMVSGYLINRDKIVSLKYVNKKIMELMVPYITYLIIETIFMKEALGLQGGIKDNLRLIWGGRAIAGVHWYITCFLFSLVIFSLLLRNFTDNTAKLIILLGGENGSN